MAVDDFGTGYSSLAQIARMPVDLVKIDRIFVEGLLAGGRHADLAAAIVRIGAALGMDVIAEGIEDPSQVRELRRLRCRLGQGFLFAPPMSASALGAELRTDRLARRRRGQEVPAGSPG